MALRLQCLVLFQGTKAFDRRTETAAVAMMDRSSAFKPVTSPRVVFGRNFSEHAARR